MSVQGYRHAQQGMPCQDAWGQSHTGPPHAPVTVLTVADGAGSRPRSQEGAQLAVRLATSVFGARLGEREGAPRDAEDLRIQLRGAFLEVLDAFLDGTWELSGDGTGGPADFATTLTVVVLGPGWLGYTSLGDGFVVLRAGEENGEPQFHLLPQPESESEYDNETTFLSSRDAALRVRIACVRDDGVDGVMLSTDGLAQAALSRAQGPVPLANRSFAASVLRSLDRPGPDPRADARELEALLLSDRLTALNADDKTLVRAVRTTGGPEGGKLP
ncbi:PP2C family serine/threonine-protein phosphatase [Streptomyces sp. ISL-100]|uniref:PP2C family serine/threonine-protein phosphatase n=1 Tax=Streptomyces sp. ISL-100 TaxID=2819173 RepID=UPI001BEBBC55|nr:PP2C family serine/threonine-protein phosphatase [Streptomyces sp. ISL-100]MBT2398195.1 protein phosphatase 2C domain-containing protein [Streptomyces sp. ISL-100]